MKQFLLFIAGILFFLSASSQIRYEASIHGYTSFNHMFGGNSENADATEIQNVGIRVGAAINMWSDIQVGVSYQERRDFATPQLLIETRYPRAAEVCADNRLIRDSKTVELEALFRLRSRQFERIHTFVGFGLAYAYAADIHQGDSTVFTTTVRRGNGTRLNLECGFPQSPFTGSQIAVLVAPGIRARLTHRIHLELEGQMRYHPFYRSVLVSGLGLNAVYNLY